MIHLFALLAGTLFGLGLVISGMTQPARVIGFLDFTGSWDPTLAFVMGGALAVFAPAYLLSRRRSKPVVGDKFDLPTKTEITWQLLAGAAIFGLGWGASGFCPGTAITTLPTASVNVLGLVGGIAVGILVTRAIQSSRTADPAQIPQADF